MEEHRINKVRRIEILLECYYGNRDNQEIASRVGVDVSKYVKQLVDKKLLGYVSGNKSMNVDTLTKKGLQTIKHIIQTV